MFPSKQENVIAVLPDVCHSWLCSLLQGGWKEVIVEVLPFLGWCQCLLSPTLSILPGVGTSSPPVHTPLAKAQSSHTLSFEYLNTSMKEEWEWERTLKYMSFCFTDDIFLMLSGEMPSRQRADTVGHGNFSGVASVGTENECCVLCCWNLSFSHPTKMI